MQARHDLASGPIAFPWSNTQVLAESLKSGELCLSNAIGQFNAVMRETLKIIEDFSSDQIKSFTERKLKLERMDKIVNDLTEKCQCMQQALLYKEEKYDEKCREVERYKVICELSSKAAVQDDLYFTNKDPNNNHLYEFEEDKLNYNADNDELQAGESAHTPRSSVSTRKNLKSHIKLNQAQMHMSDYVEPLLVETKPNFSVNRATGEKELRDNIASYYVGGPCKRKAPDESEKESSQKDLKFRERLGAIGGINVKGPTIRSGPVPLDKIYKPFNTLPSGDYQNKRVKIALCGQGNEVMSSSRNAVYQMKQKFTEKDLHRQVAEGCWNRFSSRRKKDWPF